jgi:hypothetical protein
MPFACNIEVREDAENDRFQRADVPVKIRVCAQEMEDGIRDKLSRTVECDAPAPFDRQKIDVLIAQFLRSEQHVLSLSRPPDRIYRRMLGKQEGVGNPVRHAPFKKPALKVPAFTERRPAEVYDLQNPAIGKSHCVEERGRVRPV